MLLLFNYSNDFILDGSEWSHGEHLSNSNHLEIQEPPQLFRISSTSSCFCWSIGSLFLCLLGCSNHPFVSWEIILIILLLMQSSLKLILPFPNLLCNNLRTFWKICKFLIRIQQEFIKLNYTSYRSYLSFQKYSLKSILLLKLASALVNLFFFQRQSYL